MMSAVKATKKGISDSDQVLEATGLVQICLFES